MILRWRATEGFHWEIPIFLSSQSLKKTINPRTTCSTTTRVAQSSSLCVELKKFFCQYVMSIEVVNTWHTLLRHIIYFFFLLLTFYAGSWEQKNAIYSKLFLMRRWVKIQKKISQHELYHQITKICSLLWNKSDIWSECCKWATRERWNVRRWHGKKSKFHFLNAHWIHVREKGWHLVRDFFTLVNVVAVPASNSHHLWCLRAEPYTTCVRREWGKWFHILNSLFIIDKSNWFQIDWLAFSQHLVMLTKTREWCWEGFQCFGNISWDNFRYFSVRISIFLSIGIEIWN